MCYKYSKACSRSLIKRVQIKKKVKLPFKKMIKKLIASFGSMRWTFSYRASGRVD